MSDLLTLAEIHQNDPSARGPRYLCPMPACAGKPRDAAHRSINVGDNGLWHCHRCGGGGQLKEFWADKPKKTARQRSMEAARKAFG